MLVVVVTALRKKEFADGCLSYADSKYAAHRDRTPREGGDPSWRGTGTQPILIAFPCHDDFFTHHSSRLDYWVLRRKSSGAFLCFESTTSVFGEISPLHSLTGS
jgi:hypothetical protein